MTKEIKKCPFCTEPCPNAECAWKEEEPKKSMFDVDNTSSFITGKLVGRIEALEELLDMGINDKNIRLTIEIKLKANKEVLELLQKPTKM